MHRPFPPRRFTVEELERRDTPALAVVSGTPDHDLITIQNLSGATVRVTVASFSDPDYTTPTGRPTTTTVDGTDGLSILAGEGDDTVKVVGDTPLNGNTRIDGGAGNDRVAVFAGLAQPVTFAGGAGTDTVDLFAALQNTQGNPEGDILFATDAAVARQRNDAVFFTGTESTVVHGTRYPDILVATAGLPAPVTFEQGGGQVIDTVYLEGSAGDDVFYASDAAVDRGGDAAVFLPADPTSAASVTIRGHEGDDRFYVAPVLALRPRVPPSAFGGDYFFDGGAGRDGVYVGGTAAGDGFGLTGFGYGFQVRRDPTEQAVFLANTEVISLYGFGGDDTLTVRDTYFGNNIFPVTTGFAAGDGADTVRVEAQAADDPAVAARYQFGPDRVDGPNDRRVFFTGVEATRVVNFPADG